MQIIIPSEIPIGGIQWKILRKPLAEIDSECNGGWCRWEQCEMWIANDVPIDRQEQLFFHELLHGVNVYLSEKEVEYLASILYQVFKAL